jgi:hypothetical protein
MQPASSADDPFGMDNNRLVQADAATQRTPSSSKRRVVLEGIADQGEYPEQPNKNGDRDRRSRQQFACDATGPEGRRDLRERRSRLGAAMTGAG